MKEAEIEDYLVKRATAMGGVVRKVTWQGRRGAPDRLVLLPVGFCKCCVPARAIWIELKAPGKKPTAQQLEEHARLREFGLDVRVIDSLAGVDEVLGG